MTDPTPDASAIDAPPAEQPSTGEPDAAGGPFELAALRQIVRMMEKHGLTEVSLKSGETHWRLRRGPEVVPGFAPMPQPYALPAAAPQPVAPQPAAAPAAPSAPAAEGTFIKSPTVGTFYASATPDDPPFVSVGSRVEKDTTVCLVEAMKVFNQIAAEVSGTIAEVLVKNGDSVEFGQPLFRVR